jgi:hypothetical protein
MVRPHLGRIENVLRVETAPRPGGSHVEQIEAILADNFFLRIVAATLVIESAVTSVTILLRGLVSLFA